jgi:hypothetical protein
MQYIQLFMPVAVAIITGLFGYETYRHKRYERKHDAREQLRAEETRLQMGAQRATMEHLDALTVAVVEGKNNGELAKARESTQKVKADYDEFLERVTAERVAKL